MSFAAKAPKSADAYYRRSSVTPYEWSAAPRVELHDLFGGPRFRSHFDDDGMHDVPEHTKSKAAHCAYSPDGVLGAFVWRVADDDAQLEVERWEADLKVRAYASVRFSACVCVGAAFVDARTLALVTAVNAVHACDLSEHASDPARFCERLPETYALAALAADETIDAVSGAANGVLVLASSSSPPTSARARRRGQSSRRLTFWRVAASGCTHLSSIDLSTLAPVRCLELNANASLVMIGVADDASAAADAAAALSGRRSFALELYDVATRARLLNGRADAFAFASGAAARCLAVAHGSTVHGLRVADDGTLRRIFREHVVVGNERVKQLCFVGHRQTSLLALAKDCVQLVHARDSDFFFLTSDWLAQRLPDGDEWSLIKRPAHDDFALAARGSGDIIYPILVENVDDEAPATLVLFRASLLVFMTLARTRLGALALQCVVEAVAGDLACAALSDAERTRIFTAARVNLATRRQRAHLLDVDESPPPPFSTFDIYDFINFTITKEKRRALFKFTRYLRLLAPNYARDQLEPLGPLSAVAAAERAADNAAAAVRSEQQRLDAAHAALAKLERAALAAARAASEAAQRCAAARGNVDALGARVAAARAHAASTLDALSGVSRPLLETSTSKKKRRRR